MKNKIVILAFIAAVMFVSCGAKKLTTKTITITRADGTTIDLLAEVAKTTEERNHGFMERKNIPDGTGMVFVFEQDQILSFWMKNTPHPLSIAYVDSRGKIRDMFDMKPYSLSPIVSSGSCRYALEVPKGWYEKNNIKVGDYISLDFLNN